MKQRTKFYRILLLFLLVTFSVAAQKAERKSIREGNKLYEKENYEEAIKSYHKGLAVNPTSLESTYNLGNAFYRQEKYEEAMEQYQQIAEQGQRLINDDPENMEKLSQVFHNMGNIGMKQKQYAQSIEAYKQALRLNPLDDETRYNLALAQKLLEDQQGEGDDGDNEGENDDQQDQKQDQDNENQNDQNNQDEDEQDQEQDQNQDQQQDENEEEQEQEQPDHISRENAQQILDALLEDEKETQEKVQQLQQQQQQRRRTDKEW